MVGVNHDGTGLIVDNQSNDLYNNNIYIYNDKELRDIPIWGGIDCASFGHFDPQELSRTNMFRG